MTPRKTARQPTHGEPSKPLLPEPSPAPSSEPVPPRLRKYIDAQRTHLNQASALLTCLQLAVLHAGEDDYLEPACIAEIVMCLVDEVNNALDEPALTAAVQAEPRERGLREDFRALRRVLSRTRPSEQPVMPDRREADDV